MSNPLFHELQMEAKRDSAINHNVHVLFSFGNLETMALWKDLYLSVIRILRTRRVHGGDRNQHTQDCRPAGTAREAGGKHGKYTHPTKPGSIVVPRHKEQSRGVARSIAKMAGWI
jgi:hypothetical protein